MVSTLPTQQCFCIRADSYFGCWEAAKKLLDKGQQFTLACRKDHPSALFAHHLVLRVEKQADTWATLYFEDPQQCGKVMAATTFNQKKEEGERAISFLSNLYSGKERKKKKNQEIPDVAYDYNQLMGFVDQKDFYATLFAYPHRLHKWTHAIFFWMLEAMIHNCWIIWNQINRNGEDFATFRKELALEMRGKGKGTSKEHGLQSRKTKADCIICLRQGKRSKTTLWCGVCGKAYHRNCYPVYHHNIKKRKGLEGAIEGEMTKRGRKRMTKYQAQQRLEHEFEQKEPWKEGLLSTCPPLQHQKEEETRESNVSLNIKKKVTAARLPQPGQ